MYLLKCAEIELDKWLDNLKNDSHDVGPRKELIDVDDLSPKILGISWSPQGDYFFISPRIEKIDVLSKHHILSVVAKIFDSMGFLSPITIRLKQFLQSFWRLKLDWDQLIPSDLIAEWISIYSPFVDLHSLKIPRWYGVTDQSQTFQLIGFGDGSELSYGAAVYLRTFQDSSDMSDSLLYAKTRVAPLKTISIPSLELCAANLLVTALIHDKNSLKIPISEVFCFSDSKVVLAWLSKHPTTWQTYVANRVSHIQTSLLETHWAHIESKKNFADLNSRGISVAEYLQSNLQSDAGHNFCVTSRF